MAAWAIDKDKRKRDKSGTIDEERGSKDIRVASGKGSAAKGSGTCWTSSCL